MDGGADSQKGGWGGEGVGAYTPPGHFFEARRSNLRAGRGFGIGFLTKMSPVVYTQSVVKMWFSERIHHRGIFFYRCPVVYTKTPQNMKIPYTPPGVFFGQNPGGEQFLVVIFPARRQKKAPGGVYASCCLRLRPRVGTMGGQIVIELMRRLMAVF